MFRTRAPLSSIRRYSTARLACVRPPASVHPEPGSNSPLYVCLSLYSISIKIDALVFFPYLVVICYVNELRSFRFLRASNLSSYPWFASAKVKSFSESTKTFLKFFFVTSKIVLIYPYPSPALPLLSNWDCKCKCFFINSQKFWNLFLKFFLNP